jgi:hypothetical protein
MRPINDLENKVTKIRIFITITSFLVLIFVIPLFAKQNPSDEVLNKKISENNQQLQQIKFEIDSLGINEKLKRKIPLSAGEIKAYKQLAFKLDRISKRTILLTLEHLKSLNLKN